MRSTVLFLVAFCILALPHRVLGQAKPAGAAKSPLCTQENALEMIRQQVELAKSLGSIQRITALIRAADLLWPYQQDKARAAFTDAFDLAIESEKEAFDAPRRPRSLILRMQINDQRYVVVSAIFKRDAEWAKMLVQQIVKADAAADEVWHDNDSLDKDLTSNRLLFSADQLVATDMNAALELARTSLNYPASFLLTHFLYRLAEVNQKGADQFYAQALAAYGDKPLREFLYLQAYPFAWRETLNTPSYVAHENIPAGFVPNRTLQRRLVQVLLRRAQQVLEVPLDKADGYVDPSGSWRPGTVHLLQGLVLLEPQVRESLPDLLPALTEAREKLLVSISVENQKLFLQPGREATVEPAKTFAELVEAAQKESDLYERDQQTASEILGSRNANFADVVQAIDKINDAGLRAQLTEWFYFSRATAIVKEKQFDEAERLTAKVEGLEQRAFLHLEIAKGLLNRKDVRAQDVLEVAITEAKKAGVTIFAARTLLTAATLYAKIDFNRSIEILADAINCINRIDAPDFVKDDQAVEKTPVRLGRGGQYEGEYVFRFYMPGLDPESAFRELGKIDLDTALSQSTALKDKFQRAMSTLALADVCLQQTPRPKAKKK
jgi:hypothetical protein